MPKRSTDPDPPRTLPQLNAAIVECTRCPSLRRWCAEVATRKRRAYVDDNYWGRPVPGFGDPAARVLLVGLAPGAHGANRTGRMFTGDRSGDVLYAALHRAGYANQAQATDVDDGLMLSDLYITAALRCAPPGNAPTAEQRAACAPYLERDIELIAPRVILCLGGIAWTAVFRALATIGVAVPRPRPTFGHGELVTLETLDVIGSYHVSQQNTFTGRPTPAMMDEILALVRTRVASTS